MFGTPKVSKFIREASSVQGLIGVLPQINSHKVNSHEVNSHKVNTPEINSMKYITQ